MTFQTFTVTQTKKVSSCKFVFCDCLACHRNAASDKALYLLFKSHLYRTWLLKTWKLVTRICPVSLKEVLAPNTGFLQLAYPGFLNLFIAKVFIISITKGGCIAQGFSPSDPRFKSRLGSSAEIFPKYFLYCLIRGQLRSNPSCAYAMRISQMQCSEGLS